MHFLFSATMILYKKGTQTSIMFIGGGIGTNLISRIVSDTAGYSCSGISAIAQEAVFGPLRSLGGMDGIRDAKSQDGDTD